MKTRYFYGNPPEEYDALIGVNSEEHWALYLLKRNDQILSLKLVATESKPDKANYWLQFSKRMGRLIRSKDAGLLAEHRSDIYLWVERALKSSFPEDTQGPRHYGDIPPGYEQMPHLEMDDAEGNTWAAVMLLPAGWPYVNVKLVYVETASRQGRANYTLGYRLDQERWAESKDYSDAVLDPALGDSFLARVKELIESWVEQHPHLLVDPMS